MRLSTHFDSAEFECNCGCGFNATSTRLVEGLQALRDYFGVPIRITSGCRCRPHNRKVGGSHKSQHLLGNAADIVVQSVPPDAVAAIAEQFDQFRNGGIGRYETFTHLDVRGHKSRWGLDPTLESIEDVWDFVEGME